MNAHLFSRLSQRQASLTRGTWLERLLAYLQHCHSVRYQRHALSRANSGNKNCIPTMAFKHSQDSTMSNTQVSVINHSLDALTACTSDTVHISISQFGLLLHLEIPIVTPDTICTMWGDPCDSASSWGVSTLYRLGAHHLICRISLLSCGTTGMTDALSKCLSMCLSMLCALLALIAHRNQHCSGWM